MVLSPWGSQTIDKKTHFNSIKNWRDHIQFIQFCPEPRNILFFKKFIPLKEAKISEYMAKISETPM